MELFVVKNNSNEIVQGGFASKQAAKEVRNKLQSETKHGVPEGKDRPRHRAWSFRIALGKDHRHFS